MLMRFPKISFAVRAGLLCLAFGICTAKGADAQQVALYQVTITPTAGQKMPSTTAYLSINYAVNPTSTHTVDFWLSNIDSSYMGIPGFFTYATNQGYYGHSTTNLATTSYSVLANKTVSFQATLSSTIVGGSNCYTSANVYEYLDSMKAGGTVSFVLSSDTNRSTLTSGSINVAAQSDGTTYVATFKGTRIK